MGPSRVQKGDAAVLFLSALMTDCGLILLRPVSEDLPFDLVLFHAGRYYRIQVKRAQRWKGGPRFEIPFRKVTVNTKLVKTYRYSADQIEYLVGVVLETRDVYVFPVKETLAIKATIQVDPNHTSSRFSNNRHVDPEHYRNVLRLPGVVINLGR